MSSASSSNPQSKSHARSHPSKVDQNLKKPSSGSRQTSAPQPWPLPNLRPNAHKSTKPLVTKSTKTVHKTESTAFTSVNTPALSAASSSSTLRPPALPDKDWKPSSRYATYGSLDLVQLPHVYPVSSNKAKSTLFSEDAPSHTPYHLTMGSSKTATSSRVQGSHSNHHTSTGNALDSHVPLSLGFSTSTKTSAAIYYNPFSDLPMNLPPPISVHKSSRIQSSGMPVYLPSPSNVVFEGIHHGPYFVTPPLTLPKEELRDEDVPISAAIGIDEDIRGLQSVDEDSISHLRPESKRRRRVRAGLSLQSDLAYSGDSLYFPIDSKGDVIQFPSLLTPLRILQSLGPQSKRNGCDLKAYGMEPIIGACETFLAAYKTLVHQLSDSEVSLDGQDHPVKLAREFEQLIRKERYSPFVDNVYAYHRDVKEKADVMCDRLGRYYYLTIYSGKEGGGLEDTREFCEEE